jgi:AraC family ethanolamine operon transcriptional activator
MLQTTDFDELALAFRGWDARFHQLSRGQFRGALHFLQAGAVQVFDVAVNRVIQARGLPRPGSYAFSLVTSANADSKWRGRILKPGQININTPGAPMDHLSASEYRSLAVVVDGEALHKCAEVLYRIDLEERLRGVVAFAVAPAAFARLSDTLHQLLAARRAQTPSLLPPFADRIIEHACLRSLLRAVVTAAPLAGAAAASPSRSELARRAEEYMIANLDKPLLAEDVCAEVGASERSLRYAFRDAFGLSPKAYFKAKKLNAVRRMLKGADPGSATVHEIAWAWGFEHTGNFAADYFRLFGERPADTLHGRELAPDGRNLSLIAPHS